MEIGGYSPVFIEKPRSIFCPYFHFLGSASLFQVPVSNSRSKSSKQDITSSVLMPVDSM